MGRLRVLRRARSDAPYRGWFWGCGWEKVRDGNMPSFPGMNRGMEEFRLSGSFALPGGKMRIRAGYRGESGAYSLRV
jgi:hypothetical protein